MSRDYEEKRDFHRMQIDCAVQIRDMGTGESVTAEGRDLSAQGFSFYADRSYPMGAVLEAVVSPEHALVRPLHAELEVVRVEPEGQGYLIGAQIRRMME
ncbi:MAG: PilZ domain-containing protein [Thioalkalivibrio sp.]